MKDAESIALRKAQAQQLLLQTERDARFPRVEALGTLGRTLIGDPGAQGNYAAAGINVEIPVIYRRPTVGQAR